MWLRPILVFGYFATKSQTTPRPPITSTSYFSPMASSATFYFTFGCTPADELDVLIDNRGAPPNDSRSATSGQATLSPRSNFASVGLHWIYAATPDPPRPTNTSSAVASDGSGATR